MRTCPASIVIEGCASELSAHGIQAWRSIECFTAEGQQPPSCVPAEAPSIRAVMIRDGAVKGGNLLRPKIGAWASNARGVFQGIEGVDRGPRQETAAYDDIVACLVP